MPKGSKRYVVIALGAALALAVGFVAAPAFFVEAPSGSPAPRTSQESAVAPKEKGRVAIGARVFRVDVARSEEELVRGLAGREKLTPDEGMLFTFVVPDVYNFWMKDMKFPLDFIWIRGGEVVGITENAQVELDRDGSELTVYSPQSEVDNVLEVNAGTAAAQGIQVGDPVAVRTSN